MVGKFVTAERGQIIDEDRSQITTTDTIVMKKFEILEEFPKYDTEK